jgi:hypothetical protein
VLTQKLPNGESREIAGRDFRMDAQSERVFWSMFTERVTGEPPESNDETDLLYFMKWVNLLYSDAAVIHPINSIEYRQSEIGQSVTSETMNHLLDLAELRPSEAAHLTLAGIIDRAANRTRDREAAAAPKPEAVKKRRYRTKGSLRRAILKIFKASKKPIPQDDLISMLTDIEPPVLRHICPSKANAKARRDNRSDVSKAIQELREIDGLLISESPYLLGK